MFEKVDHIGVAVKNLDEALKFYAAVGIDPHHTEIVESQKVKVAFIQVGETNIELLEATSPDSPIAKFIEKRGEGVHHICYGVEDVEQSLSMLKAAGATLIDEAPKPGAHGKMVAFVHPKSANGVLTELSQPQHDGCCSH